MLGNMRRDSEHTARLAQIEHWTRQRFRLAQSAVVVVVELECVVPGCPPLETVVNFWTDADTRHQFKVFKTADNVIEADLPYTWMLNALRAEHGMECQCC